MFMLCPQIGINYQKWGARFALMKLGLIFHINQFICSVIDYHVTRCEELASHQKGTNGNMDVVTREGSLASGGYTVVELLIFPMRV